MAGACAPPCRHGTCLPVLPLDAWTSRTSPRSCPHRSHSPSPSSSPPALSPSHPKHCRRRSSSPTRSPPSPRPSVEPPSSAATPSTSSPSHASRRAPWSRRCRHPRLRPPWVLAVNSGATGHPRPRPRARWSRCEPLSVSPLFSPSFPHRSPPPHHGRSRSPPSMSPSPSRPASAQTKPPFTLLVPRGCRRAPQVASPCPAAHFRSKPNSGRRPELRSGELRHLRGFPSAPLDADEPGLRPGALRRRPRGLWRGLHHVQRSPAASPIA